MNKLLILGLLFALGAGMVVVPSSADILSPLAQYNSGIPIQDIECRDSRILMETTRGFPACVYGKSVEMMQERGWITIPNEISTKKITIDGMHKMSDIGRHVSPWPADVTLTFPEEVRVGEPFEVVLGYSYVLPSISYDDSGSEFLNYDEPERQCPETWCGDYRTRVEMSSNVDLRDEPDYVFYTYGKNTDYTPHRTYEIGHVMPPYNNTTPQQKTLTFVINEPTINYDFGIIYMSHGNGNNGLIHFYVGPYGIVRLSDEPITVLREGVPQLVPNLPEPTKKVLPEDPLTGVDDPEKLMHDLAEWMREAYLPDWIDQIEPDLRESNFPDWFIEKLFKLYPDLKAQAFTTPVWFILPSAHAQQSPSSFVYGTAYYYDLDGNKVLLANTEILL